MSTRPRVQGTSQVHSSLCRCQVHNLYHPAIVQVLSAQYIPVQCTLTPIFRNASSLQYCTHPFFYFATVFCFVLTRLFLSSSGLGNKNGTPTKCLVSKCQVYKTSGFKTSGFKTFGQTAIEIKAPIRPVFKFDILIKQKV
jgi:hypothetical protein